MDYEVNNRIKRNLEEEILCLIDDIRFCPKGKKKTLDVQLEAKAKEYEDKYKHVFSKYWAYRNKDWGKVI